MVFAQLYRTNEQHQVRKWPLSQSISRKPKQRKSVNYAKSRTSVVDLTSYQSGAMKEFMTTSIDTSHWIS